MRVSLFTSTDHAEVEASANIGADRIELYTEPYAQGYAQGNLDAVIPFARAAAFAHGCGIEVNAGHDLDAQNLTHFAANVPLFGRSEHWTCPNFRCFIQRFGTDGANLFGLFETGSFMSEHINPSPLFARNLGDTAAPH